MKKVNNQWRDPRNTWSVTSDQTTGMITAANGKYYHSNVEMAYVLWRQPPGRRSVYRGHIVAISQVTGKTLKSKSGEKVRKELNCQDCSEDEIKKYIAKSAERLYSDYFAAIDADHRAANSLPVTPDSITPAQAVDRFGSTFLNKRYSEAASEKKKNERLNSLKQIYFGLEAVPMRQYSATQINAYIRYNALGKDAVKLAGDFWEFCLDRLYASGTNPFPAFAEKRISPTTLQARAMRAQTLSKSTFEALFDLLAKNASGKDCGVALLASGFTAEQVCGLRWRNLIFDPSREDYVQVALLLAERAGAQHNYTRPCIPPSCSDTVCTPCITGGKRPEDSKQPVCR